MIPRGSVSPDATTWTEYPGATEGAYFGAMVLEHEIAVVAVAE